MHSSDRLGVGFVGSGFITRFHSGREVVELLISAYMSAEQERTLDWTPDGLRDFVPVVQEGTWTP